MSEATQTQTLEQTLNRTDFGHVLFENRKAIFAALIAVLVAVTGYVLWSQSKKSKAQELAGKVFDFSSKTWTGAKEGKVAIPELVKQFQALDADVQTSPTMIPLVLEMGKFLVDKGSLAEAEMILSKANTSHPVAGFFVASQRAVVLEKLGKVDEAISALEGLAKDKEAVMAPRLNLELGRLNLVKGEKGKAQTHFEYVLNTYPNDEHAKLAKLYLGKLAQ